MSVRRLRLSLTENLNTFSFNKISTSIGSHPDIEKQPTVKLKAVVLNFVNKFVISQFLSFVEQNGILISTLHPKEADRRYNELFKIYFNIENTRWEA